MKTFETPAFFRHERGFLWAYIIIAFVTIVGGTYAFNSRVQSIAPSLFAQDVNRNDTVDPIEQRLQELADQKLIDSDGDGINDFDEQFVYKTSPYLADSDSDGISDSTEIANGSDPICAAGSICATVVNTNTSTTTNVAASNTNTPGLDTNSAASVLQDLSDLPPAQLRSQLLTMGISQSVLDAIPDDQLVETYQQALDSYTKNANVTTTNANPYPTLSSNNTNASNLSQLRNANISDIRALLKANGATDEQLSTVDDASLQQLFNDTLDQQEQATQQAVNP